MEKTTLIELFGEINDKYIYEAGQPWKKKRFYQRGYLVKAACAILIFGILVGSIFNTQVRAAWETFTTMISNMLGISEDIAPFTEMNDISITKNGVNLTLKEIILDNDELLILLTHGNEEARMPLNDIGIIGDVWIDGQRLVFQEFVMTDGGLDGISSNHLLGFYIDDNIVVGNTAKIKAIFTITENDSFVGAFEYNVTVSKEQITKNTATIPLEQTINETGMAAIELHELTLNSVNSRIYGKCPELILGRNYYLIGNDSFGNPITYSLEIYNDPDMVFIKDRGRVIAPEAEFLELQLFVHVIDGEILESGSEVEISNREGILMEQEDVTDEGVVEEEVVEEVIQEEGTMDLEQVGDIFTIMLR